MSVDHLVWTDVRVAECRLNATASDKHVGGGSEVLRYMDCWTSVGGCGFGLDARDLKPEVVE